MSSMPPSSPAPNVNTGAVIRRLLRDYVGGQWGLLLLAIFCEIPLRAPLRLFLS